MYLFHIVALASEAKDARGAYDRGRGSSIGVYFSLLRPHSSTIMAKDADADADGIILSASHCAVIFREHDVKSFERPFLTGTTLFCEFSIACRSCCQFDVNKEGLKSRMMFPDHGKRLRPSWYLVIGEFITDLAVDHFYKLSSVVISNSKQRLNLTSL